MKNTSNGVLKYFRIRKYVNPSSRGGFEFIAYSKVKSFGLEFADNLLTIEFITYDQEKILLTQSLSKDSHKAFIRNWNIFLLNDVYFYDLADFTRSI
jgi:hypothetical protein